MSLRSAFAPIAIATLLAFSAPMALGQSPESGLLNAAAPIGDNLRRLQQSGKPVELVLENGKSYKGKLGTVGDHAVVVTQIEGREFFDALVLIEEIAAIEVRARDR